MRRSLTGGMFPSAISGCSPETWLLQLLSTRSAKIRYTAVEPSKGKDENPSLCDATGCPRRGASRRGKSSTLMSLTSLIGVRVL